MVAAIGLLAIVLLALGFNAERLRGLLPHTTFNSTLARAGQALAEGRLMAADGSGARELYLAVRAQDPDSEAARQGLQAVGERLLAQAGDALDRGDEASASTMLDAARELLGGGSGIEGLERRLQRNALRDDALEAELVAASSALAAGQLLGEDGAASRFRHVLDLDAGNAIALAGLDRVAGRLAEEARAGLAAGNFEAAGERIEAIARAAPAWPGLVELRARLAAQRGNARDEIALLLRRAGVALETARGEAEERAALALFREVLAREPANPRAGEGVRDLARRWLERAKTARATGREGEALRLLGEARALAPELVAAELAASGVQGRPPSRRSVGAGLEPADRARLRRLVREASAAATAGHIVLPPEESAWDRYRAALAIDPADGAARAGLAGLPARARELFEAALGAGNPWRAYEMFDALGLLEPTDPGRGQLRERLADAFLDLADLRLGRGEDDETARALAAARELAPASARLGELGQRLEAFRAARPQRR